MGLTRRAGLALVLAAAAAAAQDPIRLWDGQPRPFFKDNAVLEKQVEVWGTSCLEGVTDPAMTVYRAEGRNTGIAVLVVPGGGYNVVAIQHEGHDVARALARRGITAAVLKYRLPDPRTASEPGQVPLADARRALKLLRQRAADYGLDRRRLGIMGFSAGSHLATVASLWKSPDADENPAFSCLVYGVTELTAENLAWLEESLYHRKLTAAETAANRLLDLVDKTAPPAFLVHACDDGTCRVEESTLYAERLRRAGVPVELHLFTRGGHGFGLGRAQDGTDAWLPLFATWVTGRWQ